MNEKTGCEYETAVVRFQKSGVAGDDVKEHLKCCADCQETLKIVRFFQTELQKEAPAPELPAAGLIWWKSRLREKQRAAERVGQPLLIVQIAAVVVFAGFFFLLVNTDSFGAAFSRLAESLAQFIFPVLIGFFSFALISLATVLLMRRLLPGK